MSDAPDVLRAPYALEYTYRRSTGPVIGKFLGGLKVARLIGARTASGKVVVPPKEYCPETGEEVALGDLVEVGQTGTVTTWAWVTQPKPEHPLDRPFAFALIQLEGADTAMLHAVDAGDADRMKTGMRVEATWRDAEARSGSVLDLACFVPVEEDSA